MRQGAWCQKVEIWVVREINLHCCGHTRMAATQRCFGEVFGWAHAPPHPWGLALGILPYTGTKRPKAEVPLLVGVLKQIVARVKVVYQINLFCRAGVFFGVVFVKCKPLTTPLAGDAQEAGSMWPWCRLTLGFTTSKFWGCAGNWALGTGGAEVALAGAESPFPRP